MTCNPPRPRPTPRPRAPSTAARACSTPAGEPCAISASRSRIDATSAVPTACPREVFGRDYAFLPHSEVLTYEEIHRFAGIAVALGVRKLRITGGEPLVRRALPELIALLAELRTPEGHAVDLTLTTNGSALRPLAGALAVAGLQRITVSLDSLDDETFRRMNGVDFPVARVLDGIAAAREAGLAPIKVNMVVKKGENEASIVPMARWARDAGLILRFIEYMDVGTTNGWRLDDVVTSEEIVAAIDRRAAPGTGQADVPRRGRGALDATVMGLGEIGVISSVSQPFCGDCTRARLSAEGKLYTCLFSAAGTDLRGPLREGASDDELRAIVEAVWSARADRYSELRSQATSHLPRIEMFAVGG